MMINKGNKAILNFFFLMIPSLPRVKKKSIGPITLYHLIYIYNHFPTISKYCQISSPSGSLAPRPSRHITRNKIALSPSSYRGFSSTLNSSSLPLLHLSSLITKYRPIKNSPLIKVDRMINFITFKKPED